MLRSLQRKISSVRIPSECGSVSFSRGRQLVSFSGVSSQLPRNFIPGIRAFSDLPSHKIVPMPSLSPTMETGSIARWNIKEGERFDAGTALCDVETDKATVSFDATEEGYLAKILVGTGEVKVGQPIMVTVEEAEDVSAFRDFSIANTSAASTPSSSSQAAPPAASTPAPSPSSAPSHSSHASAASTEKSSSERIFASPLARKLARESTVSIEQVFGALNQRGSGANNRIVSEDVKRALPIITSAPKASSAPATTAAASSASTAQKQTTAPVYQGSAPFVDFEVADAARELANRLAANKQAVPHYYVSVEMNLSQLMKLRDQFNQQLGGNKSGTELSVLDFLVKATAAAMRQVPDVNATWMDTFVRRYEQVDINLVMGSGSLLATPVLRNVNGRGLSSLAQEIQQFETSLFSEDNQVVESFLNDGDKHATGTFAIHNLGIYGVKSAAPIVMSPQACALAFGVIQETVIPRKPTEDSDKDWEVAPMMMATLSCDHRVVDGAVSAQYLSVLKQLVENPVNLLL